VRRVGDVLVTARALREMESAREGEQL